MSTATHKALIAKLRSLGPPSVKILLAKLEEAEDYLRFLEIVRDLLPEDEIRIMSRPTPGDQMREFAACFEMSYFPLRDDWYEDFTYTDFCFYGMPVIVLGVGLDDYYELAEDGRDGLCLMSCLLESIDGEEIRTRFRERCARVVPLPLLLQVPGEGITRSEAHDLLDGSRYEAVALWADILHGATNNAFLDTDWEELSYSNLPQWSREEAEGFRDEWRRAEAMQSRLYDFVDWLEAAPEERFAEILNFIQGRR